MSLKNTNTFSNIKYFADRFPHLDRSAIESCLSLIYVARDLIDAFDAHFSRHNLSKGRFQILMTLYRKGGDGHSPAELAEGCGVTRATITGLLDTLESAGLIERVPDPNDRRALKVRLTAAGESALLAILPDHYGRIARLMQGLSADERQVLMTLIEKIESGIPAVRDP